MNARETLIAAVEALEKMGFAILSHSELEAKDKEIAKLLAERDALAAALKAEREDGWQPIETAPKPEIGADGFGERLLLVVDCGDGTTPSVRRGYWEGTDWYLDCCMGLATASGYRVTHWRPLPAPPTIEWSLAERDEATSLIQSLTARIAELVAERDLLQDILDSRPAINAALPDSYIKWSQAIYSGDAARRALEGGQKE